MEYVAGRTLRDILREGRKILPERALEITSGVLSALDYSHRAGIIHRDIKPGNVMLTPSGDVKVMDFGIARAMQRRVVDDDPDRGRGRHRAVPLPRAGPRRDRRLPLRRLLGRLPALRAAHRSAAVRRRQPGGGRLPARPRAGRAPVRPRHRPPARGRRDRDEGAGEAGRGPLPVRRRDAQRHRALPRRPARARHRAPRPDDRAHPGGRGHGHHRRPCQPEEDGGRGPRAVPA